MSSLGSLFVNIGANTASFQSGLTKAEHQLRSFSDRAKMAQIESSRSLKQIASDTNLVTSAIKTAVAGFSVKAFASIPQPLSNNLKLLYHEWPACLVQK